MGWDTCIRGRIVRTGASSSPNLAQIPGPELLVESKHSQHVQPDMTKDNSMRKQLACIPQFKPIGNDSIKQEKQHFTHLHLAVCIACVVKSKSQAFC